MTWKRAEQLPEESADGTKLFVAVRMGTGCKERQENLMGES